MFSGLRKHMTPSMGIALLALVFALTGGAFAASNGSGRSGGKANASVTDSVATTAKAKQKSKAGARGPAGPKGATGAAGAAGVTGPAGSTGPAGPVGPTGTGATGATGAAGATGATGATGPEGKSGFTKTLPKGERETGEWSLITTVPGAQRVATAVSFNIPLPAAPTSHLIRVNGKEAIVNAGTEEQVASTVCLGSVTEPKASAGNLCIYSSSEENTQKFFTDAVLPEVCSLASAGACIGVNPIPAADEFGFGLETIAEAEGIVNVAGTWAVTAG